MTSTYRSLQDLLMTQTIPVAFLTDVLEGVGMASNTAERLLAQEGLSRRQLAVSGHRLSVLEYGGFVRRVMAECGDLFLGFLEAPIPRRAFGVFAIGGVGCRSLQSLTDYGNLFFGLFTDQFRWELQRSAGTVTLLLRFDERAPISYRFIYQSMLLIWLRLISWFIGEELKPKAVHFSFPELPRDSHLQYLFGDNLVFSAPVNQIVFDAPSVDVPFTATEDQVRLMLRDNHNMMLVRNTSEPFTAQTRRLLVLNREEGWLAQSAIAGRLGLSENLYWRKLKKEGTTYSDILNSLKRDFALRLLADPALGIEQVAYRLHFAELSAFDKAFRKWTGLTPSDYRQQLFGA
ncbi:AraC family transcriptional regulator ligand-binding domain-containing protein [Marinobacter sp. SS21]|uniref:AraC family transcriptional regulator ligand-binding domain-containing protein n=1 Tax=Marinobacter sp. SS21 TaxID=2979460 RepID=UPI00232B4240|nr:AraC family transcriptional regulator ligand-binding domain-containing protein [Marinobacter sp. SS21]MDC0663686.1 AraC family transcriptional regulator ligand-binding domain-containing protein [Marinobacter sp. SS21]